MPDVICISFPNENNEFKFPSFADIIKDIEFKFPPAFPDFSSIAQQLNLPSPIFGNINIPNLEMNQIILSFQQLHLVQAIKIAFDKVKDLLSSILGLELVLPKIPGLNADLSDLLSGDGSIIEAIRDAIKNQVTEFTDFLNSLIPTPLLGSIDSTDIDITQKITIAVSGYVSTVITYLAEQMNAIKEAAEIFLQAAVSVVIPTLPTLPSLDEILEYLKNNIEIPPFTFTFPDPLIPNFDSSDMSLPVKLSAMYQTISTYIFSLVGEYFDKISQAISSIFTIPKVKLCLDTKNPKITTDV
jgi:hypothetical protein